MEAMPAENTRSSEVMQKCDIDWPICSHEPAVAGGAAGPEGKNIIIIRIGAGTAFSLTGIGHVEEERHRHHCEPNEGRG